MVLIYIAASPDLSSAIKNWGLVPAELYRRYGLTILTSSLLHGGIFHLLSNLYFFLVFGDNVEDDMGRGKYVLLLAASTLLGDALHVLVDPRTAVPLVGASGAISGIIAYYALQFPKTRLGMLLLIRWYRIPVGLLMLFWVLYQVFGALYQLSGHGTVSALAHLGGAGVGLLFWLHSRRSYSISK
jgi:membrane associated rhomboid family serine protease